MEVLHERIAGLDIGGRTLIVSVRTLEPRGGSQAEAKTFLTRPGRCR